jgi:hypothetical protein
VSGKRRGTKLVERATAVREWPLDGYDGDADASTRVI